MPAALQPVFMAERKGTAAQLAGYMKPWVPGAAHFSGEADIGLLYNGATFPGCNNQPVHLVTLDLRKLEVLPQDVRKLGALNLVYTNCESCDAWMMEGEDYEAEMFFKIGPKHRIKPVGPEKYPNHCQAGSSTFAPKEKMAIEFRPFHEDDQYPPVMVGGDPSWVQGDDWLFCPECDKGMEFVARIRATWLKATSFGDQDLYAFVCSDCKMAGMKMQFT